MNFIETLVRDFKIILIAIPAVFLLTVILTVSKRKRAQRAALAEQARREAENRRRMEEEQRKKEEEDRRIKAVIEKRNSELEEAIRNNPGSEKYRLSEKTSSADISPLNITQFTPVSKTRYVAFDLETTGFDPAGDSIVEIGAVRVIDGEIAEEFSQLIDPERSMPADASAVNHITDDMLTGKPKIHQVLPAFLAFVGDDVLAAHNARFDMNFLAQKCMRFSFLTPLKYFDTMTLARYWPDAPDKKLSSLLSASGLENDNAHRALGDARAVAALISATNEIRSKKKTKETT